MWPLRARLCFSVELGNPALRQSLTQKQVVNKWAGEGRSNCRHPQPHG